MKEQIPEKELRKFTLNVKKFTLGICFICNTACQEGGYVHINCANAFDEYKRQMIKDWLESEDSKRVRQPVRNRLIGVGNLDIADKKDKLSE